MLTARSRAAARLVNIRSLHAIFDMWVI